jgi:hypothetical protein
MHTTEESNLNSLDTVYLDLLNKVYFYLPTSPRPHQGMKQPNNIFTDIESQKVLKN